MQFSIALVCEIACCWNARRKAMPTYCSESDPGIRRKPWWAVEASGLLVDRVDDHESCCDRLSRGDHSSECLGEERAAGALMLEGFGRAPQSAVRSSTSEPPSARTPPSKVITRIPCRRARVRSCASLTCRCPTNGGTSSSVIETSSTRNRWPPIARSNPSTRRASSTPIALGKTVGLDDTRTKPLSVKGQVAQPEALFAANHLRVVAW